MGCLRRLAGQPGSDHNEKGQWLAEPFEPGDDAAYHAADRIPTAHHQPTEGATGHTQEDVTDRMLRPFRQNLAAPARLRQRRNVLVGNRTHHPVNRMSTGQDQPRVDRNGEAGNAG
jgi:hypothetical protein